MKDDEGQRVKRENIQKNKEGEEEGERKEKK